MGRSSFIKAYPEDVVVSSSTSKKKDSKHDPGCYKESCVWFLYAMITLSLGMAVLTFWLSLYRQQEQRVEFVNMEKSYNETVNRLKTQLSEVSLLAVENKEGRGNLNKELLAMKRGSPFGRIMKNNIPTHQEQKNHRLIMELKANTEAQIRNLTQKINSFLLEVEESHTSIQGDSEEQGSLLRETLESLEREITSQRSVISSLEQTRDTFVRNTLRSELLENEDLRQIRRDRETFSGRISSLERVTEDLSSQLEESSYMILSNMTSSLAEFRSKDDNLKSGILEDVMERNGSLETQLVSLERDLSSYKNEALERINEINKRVDHFVRSIMRLKNVPQEILLLNTRLKDLSDRYGRRS